MATVPESEWPDPHGDKPDDWPIDQWEALQFLLVEELSTTETATRMGRPRGTVASWVKRWREKYGRDFFVAPRGAGWTPEGRLKARVVKGETVGITYTDTRKAQSLALADASLRAVDLVNKAFDRYGSSPTLIALMTPKEILDLSRAACMLSARAEGLAASFGGGMPDGVPVPDVDLSALDGPGDEDDQTLDAAEDVIRRFRSIKGGAGDVIEVNGEKRAG